MKVNAFLYAKLMNHLFEGKLSCKEIAQETGLHYVTVLEYTRVLYKERVIYISRWDTDELGRYCIKVYKIGRRVDAVRPKMTQAERQAAVRERRNNFRSLPHLKT